jgi:hypothetical protein
LLNFLKKEGSVWFPIPTKKRVETGCLIETKKLNDLLKDEEVLRLFVDITMEGFKREKITTSLWNDVENHIFDYENMVIVLCEESSNKRASKQQLGRISTYFTYTVYISKGKRIFYVAGVMVYPDLQNLGLGGALFEIASKKEKADYVSYRTQNPQAYQAFRNKAREIYPNGKKIPKQIKRISKFIAFDILEMKDFDKNTMIGRKTYDGCLYGNIDSPKGKTKKIFENINPWNGDSIMVIGKI